MTTELLKFSKANTKTKALYDAGIVPDGKAVYSLDLPAGYTCPGARDCMSKCVDGKIRDGKHTQFRCFSASQEVTFPATHRARIYNLRLIRACGRSVTKLVKLIESSLPKNAGVIRYHVSGDFFSQTYLEAAYKVAQHNPDIHFYGYTKSIHLLEKLGKWVDLSKGIILPNFLLTGSAGGKHDIKMLKMGLRNAIVCYSEDEAKQLRLEIDHDDSHAAKSGGSFALLLHGIQPAGSKASQALSLLKRG